LREKNTEKYIVLRTHKSKGESKGDITNPLTMYKVFRWDELMTTALSAANVCACERWQKTDNSANDFSNNELVSLPAGHMPVSLSEIQARLSDRDPRPLGKEISWHTSETPDLFSRPS
jgi:hypothetical protein